jgi:phosphatidylinositol-3-phosphatase
MLRFWYARLGAIVITASLPACSGFSQGIPRTPPASPLSPAARTIKPAYTTTTVQLVIFENEGYGQIIGSPSAPYITSLAHTWANMTQSFAITHPSQPNYLALFSGSTQGVSDDSCPHTFTATSLGGQLLAAGLTFTGYAESMPRDGFTGCMAHKDKLASGWLYMRKHVPWTNFTDVPSTDSLVYPGALASPPSSFTWITPNMCNDMHDCSIETGDKWAKRNLPDLIAWDAANDGVLILTFDENDGSPGNQIATILMGNVNPGSYKQKINHYNVLRTIEDVFGLAPLGNAASASPIKHVVR